jgi:predicted alpha/beta hydrolase family esterase
MLKMLSILFLLTHFSLSLASNKLREMDYAEKISSSNLIGEIVWLKAKNGKFLSLFTETEKIENLGTAIILHSMAGHPDQKKMISPIRTFLPQHNWATLSLQMPVLELGAKHQDYFSLFDDANARIQAGVDYLLAADVKNIVLIGYGLGGMMAVNYLQEKAESKDIKALITISLAVPETDQKQGQILDFIKVIKQPFLDIFAEFDLPEVTDTARKRKLAGKANSVYRQLQIEGEGYLFQHDQGLVVKRIYSWINRTFR